MTDATLRDLDAIPWADLTHAYGPAIDVPALLRQLSDGDSDALDALFGNIHHQGTVYQATAPAVPFLVRALGNRNVDRSSVLSLLEAIALGESARWRDAARDAVSEGAMAYIALLDDADASLRAQAVATLGACSKPKEAIVPRLRAALGTEPDELVRTQIVFALAALGEDPDTLFASAVRDACAGPRAAAAIARGRSAGGITDDVVATLRRDVPRAFETLEGVSSFGIEGEPIRHVASALDDAGRLPIAIDLVSAWAEHEREDVRMAAVYAAEPLIQRHRSITPQLVRLLASRLGDPARDVRYWAASHLAGSGRAVGQRAVADALWALVERGPLGRSEPATFALFALAKVGDPRVVDLVAGRLESGAEAVIAALERLPSVPESFVDPLLRALRKAKGSTIAIVLALGRAPNACERALAAVRRAVPSHPHVTSRVLGDWGPAAKAALREMEGLLDRPEAVVRANAARAILRMDGERAAALPTLRALAFGETRPGGQTMKPDAYAIRFLGEVGDEGDAEALAALFSSDHAAVRVQGAVAYYALTRDHARALPILAQYLACTSLGFDALACVMEIGPPAAEIAPRLRRVVADERRASESGDISTLVDMDERWVDLCSATLARLTG